MKADNKSNLKTLNGISVIICCYDSVNRISKTLEYLSYQDAKINWEVIIIDNACCDNTSALAREVWDSYNINTDLRIVYETKSGLSYARKKGVREAKYELIIFCDDDNWLSSDYISNAYRVLNNNKNVGICGGLGFPELDSKPPIWFNEIKSGYALGSQGKGEGIVSREWVYGAGMVIKRELLIEIENIGDNSLITDRKGNELSSGGDIEICLLVSLLGYEVWFSPVLKFKHFIPKERLTDDYLFRLYKGFGKSNAMLKPLWIVKQRKENNFTSQIYMKIISTSISLLFNYISIQRNIWRKVKILEDTERLRTYWAMRRNWKNYIENYVIYKVKYQNN